MIEYRKGNLMDVKSGIIIHGCNLQGVMGAGVAKATKEKYPDCFLKYKTQLDLLNYSLGMDIMYRVNDNLLICNALTQKCFGRDKRQVNYAAIVQVFSRLVPEAIRNDLVLHFPKIGAGLGGGEWGIISQLIEDCDPDDLVTKICWEC